MSNKYVNSATGPSGLSVEEELRDAAEQIPDEQIPDEQIPDDEEIAFAGLCNAIDDLVTAARNLAKNGRDCGTVRKLKRAAISYVVAATNVLPDEERIPENLLELVREYEELDGED